MSTSGPTLQPQSDTPFAAAVEQVRNGSDAVLIAASLYARLTDDERLGLLDGDTPFWPGMREMMIEGYNLRPLPMGRVERLGIPGVQFSDGPRGIVLGKSTAFPVPMARGATWDVELEERVGLAIGREGRAQGANFFGGVCVNLPRHPAWGRVQETYSEDPLLLGEFGAALTRGVQRNLMACMKHFALNSMENARFSVDIKVDEATLHEFFLPQFRRVVAEGVSAVMSAYNSVNGEWAGQNSYLLTQVLRDDWGFEGFVISDFIWGVREPVRSLSAGLDIEAPFAQQRARRLPGGLQSGAATWDHVKVAGTCVIATQLRHYASRDAIEPVRAIVASPAHRKLAREVAARAMVLLRNEPAESADPGSERPLLPLDAKNLGSVAVLGRLADVANTGDHGSSDVRAKQVVTPLAGLRAALRRTDVRHITETDPDAAADQAAQADVAIVVVGYTAQDEGEFIGGGEVFMRPELAALYPRPITDEEKDAARQIVASRTKPSMLSQAVGGDRKSVRLRPEDVALIRAVAAANPRTVVVVVAGGAVVISEWDELVPCVVLAWYAGMEGGASLADVLLGAVDASGRLPFSMAADEFQLPYFNRDAPQLTYDRWFGQRLIDRLGSPAGYPLGWGLSYTTMELSDATARRVGPEEAVVEVCVTNTGGRDGRHVVQVYGVGADDERFLVGFASVAVRAWTSVTIEVPVSLTPLGRWHPVSRTVRVPSGPVNLLVSAYAGDPDALELVLPQA